MSNNASPLQKERKRQWNHENFCSPFLQNQCVPSHHDEIEQTRITPVREWQHDKPDQRLEPPYTQPTRKRIATSRSSTNTCGNPDSKNPNKYTASRQPRKLHFGRKTRQKQKYAPARQQNRETTSNNIEGCTLPIFSDSSEPFKLGQRKSKSSWSRFNCNTASVSSGTSKSIRHQETVTKTNKSSLSFDVSTRLNSTSWNKVQKHRRITSAGESRRKGKGKPPGLHSPCIVIVIAYHPSPQLAA